MTKFTMFERSSPAACAPGLEGMAYYWDFVPSTVPRWRTRQVVETILRRSRPRPSWQAILPVSAQSTWVVYFLFTPDGSFAPSHRFSLGRLKDAGQRVMVICATNAPSMIPAEVAQFADAIYWKAVEGYDFSAYAIALREISRRSPHANVLVINDSVFGPFTDLGNMLVQPPWELTGFTASSQIENHLQSYAFVLQDVTKARMRALSTILFPWTALSLASDVIAVQESRFARIASHSMRVGAYWFAKKEDVLDPTLVRPVQLLSAGFPFLKRSLVGKHQKMQDIAEIRELLFRLGHPLD